MDARKKITFKVIFFLLAFASLAFAGNDGSVCNISFTVTREWNGKPVRNASIVLHPVDKNGKQQANGVELKADNEGKASFEALPYGKIRVQVLAPGMQTYGEDFVINEKTREIEVKLKKPQAQYSIYDDKKPASKEAPKDPPKK
jgi:hypothetical protein